MPTTTTGPRMGLCPIGKFVFSHEDAIRQKTALQDKLREWKVDFVDLDDVLEDGLVRDQTDAPVAVQHLQQAGIDCLFVPHCNFGTEGAVGVIARDLRVPVLLWGPRDDAPEPDGTRLRDTLCGMFASSKVLHKLGVTFTYIENSGVDELPLEQGVDRFLRAVHVASALRRGTRIGLIGQRIDFFWTTIVNEGELLERFKVEVLPIDMVDFIGDVRSRVSDAEKGYREQAQELRRSCVVEGFPDDAPLLNILAVRDAMLAVARERDLEALAVQDFTSLVDAMQAYCFFANSMVSEHVPIGIESDIHGAVTTLLLKRAALGEAAPFLTDITVRHPENDNAVLLWHAGAPVSLKHPDDTVRLGSHWILPSPLSGMPHFRLREGRITVARFDADAGDYRLAIGEGDSTDGPTTLNNYVWMEVDDWAKWERTLMEGPFIHHAGMVYGEFAGVLEEACRYVPGLTPVRLGRD